MAQIYKKLEIDVNKEVTAIITAVQNDAKSRYLDIVLLDGSTAINLTGHEVRICAKKFDDTEIYNNGVITEATNGRCQFELTSQALAVAQDLEVQIILFKDNVEVLSTQPFKIKVVKSLLSDSAIESSNEYGALVVLYQNLYEAYDLMTTMVENFGEKGTISTDRNINTFWESMEYVSKYLDTDLTNLLNAVLAEANVQGVIDRLGNTADTGATEAAGTVMGKLNGLIVGNNRINDNVVNDNDIISACINFASIEISSMASSEVELLDVNGAGFLEFAKISHTVVGDTAAMDVYADDELLLTMVSSAGNYKQIEFGSPPLSGVYKLADLGELDSLEVRKSITTPNLLNFKHSLRIVLRTTRTGSYTTATVKYGLVG